MLKKEKAKERKPFEFNMDGFPDYTKKEIFMQGELVKSLTQRYIKANRICLDYLKIKADRIKRAYIVSSLDDFSVALMGAYNFEVLVDVPCCAQLISELEHSNPVLDKNTLVIAVCGSNDECAGVRRRAEAAGACFVGVFDFAPDDKKAISLDFIRKADLPTAENLLRCICVIMLLLYLGERAEVITELYIKIAIRQLLNLPKKIKTALQNEYTIKEISRLIKDKSLLLTGTGVDFAVSLYGACLLDRIGADAMPIPLGEADKISSRYDLKILFASSSELYSLSLDKSINLAIAPDGADNKTALCYEQSIPLLNPLLSMVCVQLIVYHLEQEKKKRDK